MADSTVKPDDTNDLVLQNNHGDSKIEINEDDTIVVTSGGDVTVDATGDIILDAGGADVKLKDGGVQFGTLKQASTHLVIQPESSKEIIFNDGSGTASLTVDAANQNVSINNGNIVMGTAGKGIDFAINSTENTVTASNVGKVLTDFEQGEFNPTITGDDGGAVDLSATRSGFYTRVGDIVHVTIFIENSSWTSGPTGDVHITLPFTVKASYSTAGTLSFIYNWDKTPERCNAYTNTAKLTLFKYSTTDVVDTSGFSPMDGSEVNATSQIYAQVTYRVA